MEKSMNLQRYNSEGDLVNTNFWFEDGMFVNYDTGLEMPKAEAKKLALQILNVGEQGFPAEDLTWYTIVMEQATKDCKRGLGARAGLLCGEDYANIAKLLTEYRFLRDQVL